MTAEDAEVGAYMRQHLPEAYAWVAMRERFGPPLGVYVMDRLLGWEHPDGKAEAVARFVKSASFGPCMDCFAPVILFHDGRRFEWPSFAAHENCAEPVATIPRGGVAQRTEQRSPTPPVGGANPPAASTRKKAFVSTS